MFNLLESWLKYVSGETSAEPKTQKRRVVMVFGEHHLPQDEPQSQLDSASLFLLSMPSLGEEEAEEQTVNETETYPHLITLSPTPNFECVICQGGDVGAMMEPSDAQKRAMKYSDIIAYGVKGDELTEELFVNNLISISNQVIQERGAQPANISIIVNLSDLTEDVDASPKSIADFCQRNLPHNATINYVFIGDASPGDLEALQADYDVVGKLAAATDAGAGVGAGSDSGEDLPGSENTASSEHGEALTSSEESELPTFEKNSTIIFADNAEEGYWLMVNDFEERYLADLDLTLIRRDEVNDTSTPSV